MPHQPARFLSKGWWEERRRELQKRSCAHEDLLVGVFYHDFGHPHDEFHYWKICRNCGWRFNVCVPARGNTMIWYSWEDYWGFESGVLKSEPWLKRFSETTLE